MLPLTSPLSLNSTEYATTSTTCGATMNGSRHVNLSARRDDTTAEMAPQMYGGAVSTCACVLVKPMLRMICGMVNLSA